MSGAAAAYASRAAASRGRQFAEAADALRGPRDAFQRDRDRIIHSIAFRRLRHKTQVFVAPDGDHFRVRLTHSLEVAQIGRTIARALGLNEDLTEALCLAHDIGHPPFGHAGEDALKAAMADAGGFDHNGHVLRVLMRIERPYPSWPGLNLSWETLEGLAKHNGPVADPGWALAEADRDFPLDLAGHASLEAQVAAIADDIAYDNHDIDDGLRAGILNPGALLELGHVRALHDAAAARYPGIAGDILWREVVRSQIGAMVNDVIATSQAAIAAAGIETAADVRTAGRALVGFSPAMAAHERDLKSFLYRHLYHCADQLAVAAKARTIVGGLFAAYRQRPELLPDHWRAAMPADAKGSVRHVGDFIAGMTDRYAINRYRELVGTIDLPEGF